MCNIIANVSSGNIKKVRNNFILKNVKNYTV